METYWSKQYKIRKLKAVEYKGGKCTKCGYDKCYAAMDFHHVDPSQKEFVWNDLRKRKWSDVILELDKCVLLCANCHREEHFDKFLSDNAIEWRNKIDNHSRIKCNCATCGIEFDKRSSTSEFCSNKCSAASRIKIDWPDNLPEMVAKSSKLAVAKQLGVSDKSVTRRLKNHHNMQVVK